jgi:hypothetical protein
MHLPPLAGRLLFTTMHAPNGFTHLRHLAQDPEAAAAASNPPPPPPFNNNKHVAQ